MIDLEVTLQEGRNEGIVDYLFKKLDSEGVKTI